MFVLLNFVKFVDTIIYELTSSTKRIYSHPFDLFTGLAADKKQMYHDARTAISYAVSGDTVTINVGLVGAPGGREFTFKLGEHYDSADLDGSPMKVTVFALVLIQQYVHIFLFSVSFWRPQGF